MGATQKVLIRLNRCSEDWSLPLSQKKCETSIFSMDLHQANFQHHLLFFHSPLCFNFTPTFLGVTFDCTLSCTCIFAESQALSSSKAIHCISASSWSSSEESLALLYKAIFLTLFTHVSPEWFSFLSVTKLKRLH